MKPMFFGDSKRKLYGVYHPPTGAKRRSHAVLMCYPGVQEYGTSLWGFRRLAAMLAQDGHHVLRFDYFGTGDSVGRVEEGAPSVWLADIEQAATELKDLSSARQLSVVGKRLGAALAVKACAAGLSAQRLVLWDPVTNGRDYVAELEMWDERRNLLLLHTNRRGKRRSELLGYPFATTLREELEAIDLTRESPPPVKQIAIYASEKRPAFETLANTYNQLGLTCELRFAAEADETQEVGAQGRAQLSGSILADIASGLGEVLAA
jgi:alpha/beta superfamily hydrolase